MNPDPGSAPPKNAVPLQDKIRRLVQRFLNHREVLPDVCRELCRLARHHHVPAEEFRKRLVQSGLAASRASELKQVLECRDELEKFLRPTEPQPWRDTLRAARLHAAAAKLAAERRTRADHLWSQIAGLMYRQQTFVAQVGGQELRLRPAPSPFEPQELGRG